MLPNQQQSHRPLEYIPDSFSDPSRQRDKLRLFEIQKQIEHIKQLKERNQILTSMLKEAQAKINAKIKHNDKLLTTFRYRRVRGEEQKQGIVGISFYNYDTASKVPESLQTFFELQTPKQKQNVFLKNVFQTSVQPQLPPNLASFSISLKQIVKSYPSNPSLIPFDRIGMFYEVSGLHVYELWRKEKFKSIPKKIPFTPAEDDMIICMHNRYGDNWRHMSKKTQFRSSEEMYYRFNVINTSFKKGRWTNLQNMKLLLLAEYYEAPNYHKMALKLKTRSEGQIRERYINILHPDKRVKEWSEEEVQVLLKKANDFNYKWTRLAELFVHKDDNEVWRKFRGMMAERSVDDIQQMVFDANVRRAILDYKKKYRVQSRPEGK